MELNTIKHLIFRNIFGQATEGEKARLQAWLGESEENRALYEKLCSTAFLERAMLDSNDTPRKRTWRRIIGKISPKHTLRRRAMRIAAVLAIPLIAGAAVLMLTMRSGEPEMTAAVMLIRPGSPKVVVTLANGEEIRFGKDQDVSLLKDGHTAIENSDNTVSINAVNYEPGEKEFTTYKIPAGGEYAIKLEDGTIVHLNSESEIKAPVKFGKGDRTVYFKGEGYFEVAHDPRRPFTVKTERGDIAVLGTEFNLRAYDDESETVTTLVKGSVDVVSGDETRVRMVPGTQSKIAVNGDVTVRTVDVYPYIAWKSGRIVFDNTRTEDIMNVLRRWYMCDVFYGDDAVKERRFTMDILKYDDLTQILDLMSKVNVQYVIKGHQVFLNSK